MGSFDGPTPRPRCFGPIEALLAFNEDKKTVSMKKTQKNLTLELSPNDFTESIVFNGAQLGFRRAGFF
jgi:hypothetical protein